MSIAAVAQMKMPHQKSHRELATKIKIAGEIKRANIIGLEGTRCR